MRPPLEARKAQLTLEEVRNRLAQLEGDRASRSQSDQAALAVAREKETKAQLAIQVATTILSQMVLKASMDGVVAVKDNLNINFGYQGMTLNEHRVGDQVQAGAAIAEVLDLSQLEIGADIDENDRARLAVGQSATLALDALGGRAVAGQGQLGRHDHAAAVLRPRLRGSVADVLGDARADRPGRPICGRGSPGASRSAARRRSACCTSRAAPCSSATAAPWCSCAAAAADVGGFTPTPVKVLGKTETLGGRRGRGRGHRDRARRSVAARRGVRQHAGGDGSGHAGGRAAEAVDDHARRPAHADDGRRQPASPTSCARC